jgi:chromosome segregation ATPase
MKRPFELVAEIQEKDAEIERLKLICTELARRIKDAEEALQRQDNAIIELKALLTRAADALEEEFGPGNTDLMTKDPWALIAELRKAAE